MPASTFRGLRLLGAFALTLAALAAPAHAADTPFSTRFAQTLHGDVTAVGNMLMTCHASAACTSAQNGTATGSALNNNSYTMGYVDADGDSSTFDSSSATVSLPAGSTVVWAGLYWSADTTAGAGGSAAPSPSSRGTVRFAVGGGAYQTVSANAADVLGSSLQASRYRALRDVTALVPAGGSATYRVANVQAGTGADRFAGWALFIAYRDPSQRLRRVDVYDGLGTVDETHTFTTTIAPFHTPTTGTVKTRVALLSFEGDAGLTPETASFNGAALVDGLNPAGNTLNSTIETDGAAFTAKAPNYANQLGMDLDAFSGAGALANDQTSATLSFSSTQDYFMPSAFYLVSDEAPAANAGLPAIAGTPTDGQTLTADPGTWNGTPTITYAYQWQRCDASGANCHDIAGATGTTYALTSADVGSTIRVVVTATNDAGASAPATSAQVGVVAPQPPASGGGTTGGGTTGGGSDGPSQGAAATPAPGAPVAAGGASTASPGEDLSLVPGDLTAQASCQQLVGGAKYRRVEAHGIGTIRVRAYTSGPALQASPVQLTTQVSHGRATSVRYRLDGQALRAGRGSRHAATLTPAQLQRVGLHTLKTAVRGRHGAARTIALSLRTVPCQTVFTAQRWRTTAGTGLRLRVDARTALARVGFAVPGALLPRQVATKRAIGFIRLYVGGQARRLRYALTLPRRGGAPVLLHGAGKPTVRFGRRGLTVTGLPARTAVAEVTLYRVKKLDRQTPRRVYKLRANVGHAAAPAEALSITLTPKR